MTDNVPSEKPMTANEITASLLLEIPRRFPHICVWRNNRIDAMAIGRGGVQRRVKAGIDGQGDITGIVCSPPGCICRGDGLMGMRCDARRHATGRRVEIEVKAGKDRMRPSQHAFRAMIVSHGGVYLVARTVEQAMSDLAKEIE